MESYDLVIIGGGINGVGVAQCASAAGYSVLLLEQGEIGAQTSANSSKLIHGGLRYLENAQLHLVRESLLERRALLRLAPTLVKPVRFYIPVYSDSRRSPWTIRAGLSLYAVLSEFDSLGRFESIPAMYWPKIQGLKLQGLKAVFQYWDAQTDDKLLTRAVGRSAVSLGATVLTQASCLEIKHGPELCRVGYRHQGSERLVSAKAVVNCAGPWVNRVLASVTPAIAAEAIDWVQGTHLLLDIQALDGILYLESCFDKRVIFVMPWYGKTLIGTTETVLSSLGNKPEPTREEIDYLLGIYTHYFPAAGDVTALSAKILGSFCGVRVLPRQSGNAFERPRDALLQCRPSHPRLLSLYGGKLTTFRRTAKEAVDWLTQTLGPRARLADVDELELS
ncbi:FAD-dependent oxidoreductase [Shewanella sp. AS16]|uniref:glycerol-3-phosphate dehydrogenase/oxidase n=1 Tax=Shewanella sp. AS16 TaxID=2907625 RepID=UPI001F409C3D|nr:FAD-dependent oxidoreductase [Shewanella sp. AS16]MCE9685681.1 FAD-dependent oxidoreductase [Shewanella sp. AS16]